MVIKSQQPDVVVPNKNFGAYMLERMREFLPQFDDNVYEARRNAHQAFAMLVKTTPGQEGVVEAKLVPVLVGKLPEEEDEIKVR